MTEENTTQQTTQNPEPELDNEAALELQERQKQDRVGRVKFQREKEMNDAAPWHRKDVSDWFSNMMTNPTERHYYEKTKAATLTLLNLIFGGSKEDKPVQKATGVSKNNAAPLNGKMGSIASGVSNAMNNGIKPNRKPEATMAPKPGQSMTVNNKQQPSVQRNNKIETKMQNRPALGRK